MKKFFWKDKTGRGFSNNIMIDDLLKMENDIDWNDQSLHDFAVDSENGDKWEDAASIITCITSN